MKQKSNLILWLAILSFLGSCFAFFFLPDRIPIHFNSTWEADGYGPKEMIFLLASLPVAIMGLFQVLPKIDPKKSNYLKHSGIFHLMRNIIVISMIGMNWLSIALSFYEDWNIKRILPIFTGIILILIGNYLPKMKSNYFVGIKTPWALANETVWRKTHKFGGYVFVIYGFLTMMSGIIINDYFQKALALGIFVMVIIIFGYSYWTYRKENEKNQS